MKKALCLLAALAMTPSLLLAETNALVQARQDLKQAQTDFVAKVNELSLLYVRHSIAADRASKALVTREALIDQKGYYRGKAESLKAACDAILDSRADMLNAYDDLCHQVASEEEGAASIETACDKLAADTKTIAAQIEEEKRRLAAKKKGLIVAQAPKFFRMPAEYALVPASPEPIRKPYFEKRPELDIMRPTVHQILRSNDSLYRSAVRISPEEIPPLEQYQIDVFATVRSQYLEASKPLDELANKVKSLASGAEAAAAATENQYASLKSDAQDARTLAEAQSAKLFEAVGKVETALSMRPTKEKELETARTRTEKAKRALSARQAENAKVRAQAIALGLNP